MRKRRSSNRDIKLVSVIKVLKNGPTVTEVAQELGIRDTPSSTT
jgi:hypothetical protein